MEESLLSICIPTYNRAELLEYCLEGLREFEQYDIPFEVVVSDNASEDRTQEVLRARSAKMPYLKAVRMDRTRTITENGYNAFLNASGRFVVYLADDDSLLAGQLVEYVKRMDADPNIAVLYADWIAYDDSAGKEMHRYFHFPEPACFAPDASVDLISFVLQHMVLPEMGIYRRTALQESQCYVLFARRTTYMALHWMYCMSRMGNVAFELRPFYREHRVLAPRFHRKAWWNIQLQHQMIGDEFRSILEHLVLWAFQDAGFEQVPQSHLPTIRQMIDSYLNGRVPLEVRRAIGVGDWLLAAELRRRLILWHGPGTSEQQRHDVAELVLPAALQAVALGYQQLDPAIGLLVCGFRTPQISAFFTRHFPSISLLDAVPSSGQFAALFKDASSLDAMKTFVLQPARSFRLDKLLNMYRVNTATVDLSNL